MIIFMRAEMPLLSKQDSKESSPRVLDKMLLKKQVNFQLYTFFKFSKFLKCSIFKRCQIIILRYVLIWHKMMQSYQFLSIKKWTKLLKNQVTQFRTFLFTFCFWKTNFYVQCIWPMENGKYGFNQHLLVCLAVLD